IIEQVRYAPVSARYKVYIIDEVHMLSTQAFNGLLKTLEEPPPHVKFIFATTEIRKVPVTVLSRCQRFDLRRVEASVLIDHLKKIAALEEIAVDDDAYAMIARAAEGSVRDSLSILDQAIAHGGGTVSAEAVRDMLGLADRTRIIDLFEHLMKGDLPSALGIYRDLYDAGAAPSVMLADLAEFTHLVTRLRFVPTAADDAALSPDERTRGQDCAKQLSVRVLSRAWQMLLKGISEVQGAARPVNAGEMVLIRIAYAADLPTLDEALKTRESSGTQSVSKEPGGAPAQNGGSPAAHAVSSASMTVGGSGGSAMRLVESRPNEAVPQTVQEVIEREPAPPAVALTSLDDIAALADSKRDMAFKVT
ncbi:DNA polymerase III subunit gamma/tau, partial [Devosia indica]